MADSTRDNHRRKVASDTDDVITLDEDGSTSSQRSANRAAATIIENEETDVRNEKDPGILPVAPSGIREPKLVVQSPEVLAVQQLVLKEKEHSLAVKAELFRTKQMLLESQKQAAKNEQMYKRACKGARELELRAERAEKLLEEKNTVFGGLTRSALEKMMENLKDQLKNQEKRAEKELVDLNTVLEMERNERRRANEKLDDLKNQLEEEKKKRRMANERIDQLKCKLAKFEPCNGQTRTAVAAVGDKFVAVSPTAAEEDDPLILPYAHTHNILNLLSPTAENSISIYEGVWKISTAFAKCGEGAKKKCGQLPFPYECSACNVKTFSKFAVTNHFLSEGHIEKVRAHHASVSGLAVDNWVEMLVKFEEESKRI